MSYLHVIKYMSCAKMFTESCLPNLFTKAKTNVLVSYMNNRTQHSRKLFVMENVGLTGLRYFFFYKCLKYYNLNLKHNVSHHLRIGFAMSSFSSLTPENNPSLSSKPVVTFSKENARQGNNDSPPCLCSLLVTSRPIT